MMFLSGLIIGIGLGTIIGMLTLVYLVREHIDKGDF